MIPTSSQKELKGKGTLCFTNAGTSCVSAAFGSTCLHIWPTKVLVKGLVHRCAIDLYK